MQIANARFQVLKVWKRALALREVHAEAHWGTPAGTNPSSKSELWIWHQVRTLHNDGPALAQNLAWHNVCHKDGAALRSTEKGPITTPTKRQPAVPKRSSAAAR